MRTLVLVAGLTLPLAAQDAPEDWSAVVAKAQNHRRIMVRRAAANKVAAAGDAAVAAVRAFAGKHGRNAIKLELVSAYGGTDAGGETTRALLEEWARDPEFYWRSQALDALAHRRLPALRDLFASHLADPAYLTRIAASRGLCRLGGDRAPVLALLRDEDPRVRVRVAACLVEEEDDRGLPTLVESLRQDGAFLDYPWGRLGATVAFKLLKQVAGADFGFRPGASPAENGDAIAKLDAWARGRLGDRWVDPVPAHRDATTYRGGVEIRSCRNGDLFVRWTAEREVVFGLEARHRRTLDEAAFAALDAGPPGSGAPRHGSVVCDFLRIVCPARGIDEKSAPDHLPGGSAKWLERLAAALDGEDAARIEQRLGQFRRR